MQEGLLLLPLSRLADRHALRLNSERTMKRLAFILVAGWALLAPAAARLGDSPEQTVARYGQPIASTGQSGELTSTKTFEVSGLEVTCGYVNGKVEMETYVRSTRDFFPSEVEALLRTNGSKVSKWTTPADGYVNGDYKRADGITAKLTGGTLALQSPKWADALAKDQAAEKAAAEKAAQAAATTNTANPSNVAGSATNAASSVDTPASTTNSP